MFVPHFLYIFIGPWTFGLLSLLGYYVNNAAMNLDISDTFLKFDKIHNRYVECGNLEDNASDLFCFRDKIAYTEPLLVPVGASMVFLMTKEKFVRVAVIFWVAVMTNGGCESFLNSQVVIVDRKEHQD